MKLPTTHLSHDQALRMAIWGLVAVVLLETGAILSFWGQRHVLEAGCIALSWCRDIFIKMLEAFRQRMM